MSHFIIKQNKSGQNIRSYIDNAKVNLQAVSQLEYRKILRVDEACALHYP